MTYEQIVLAVILVTRAIREAFGRREERGAASAKPNGGGHAASDGLRMPPSIAPSLAPRFAHGVQNSPPERRPAPGPWTPEPSTRERMKRATEAAGGQPTSGLGDARRLRAAIRVMTILGPPRALPASDEAWRQRRRERAQGQR
jgi:hypothetical protein